MTHDVTIGPYTIGPGQLQRIELPVARMFTQQMLQLPIVVANGKADGPRVWITAAIHGDEICGTEIARRVLEQVSPKTLRGTLVVVPVVNLWGFLEMSRYLPDRRDLNRSFPGSKKGSLASQLAHLLMTEVVHPSACGIDLHAGSNHRANLPQARGDFSDPRVLAMAEAFQAPASIDAPVRRGSLRGAAARHGIPCLLFESGTTLRMDAESSRVGTGGVLRVLKSLDMIDEAPEADGPTFHSGRSHWHRAPRAGIAHLDVTLGARVLEGERIGVIRDTFGVVTARLRCRHTGLVIGALENPLVNRGDALVHIAEPVHRAGREA